MTLFLLQFPVASIFERRCLLLCPSTSFRFPSLLKCLQLPPVRIANTKENPHHLSAKRNSATRSALVAIALFDCLVGLQDAEFFLNSLDLLVQSLDLLWGTTDVTVIHSLQSVISKIIQIIPPPPVTELSTLATVPINQNHSPIDVFWIRIVQVAVSRLGLECVLTKTFHAHA